MSTTTAQTSSPLDRDPLPMTSDDPITSFDYRGIEVRRVVRGTTNRPDGNVEIRWKATVHGTAVLAATIEEMARKIDAILDEASN
jgi:hypothetical protein